MTDAAKPADTKGAITPATLALGVAGLAAAAAIIVSVARRDGDEGPATDDKAAAAAPARSPEDRIRDLEARLLQNPDDAAGWRELGWAYYEVARRSDSTETFRMGMARSASAYRRATQLQPSNAENWSSLGEVLQSVVTEVSPEAEQAFRRALQLDPTDARSRYFLAVQKDLRGEHRQAVDDLIALLRDTPAGAPWEADLRRTINQIAERRSIDVAGRVPAPRQSAATAAIPGPTAQELEAAKGIAPAQQDQMVQGMVDRLAQRLRDNPRDEQRWMMMMRSRMVLNQPRQAAEAFRAALAAFADDTATQQRLRAAATELGIPPG